jgi:Domain of unknown function (DUF4082)
MTKFGEILTTDEVSTSGTTILNGTGPPADALGAIGNYYLDTAAKILYGPKAAPGTYGPTQDVSGATPPSTGANNNFTFGTRLRVLVPSKIVSLRYYRVLTAAHTATLMLYTETPQAEVARETFSSPASAPAGWINVPLTTPITVSVATNFRVAYYLTPTTALKGESSSALPVSAVPAAVTIVGGCTGTGVNTYPSADTSTWYYFADIAVQIVGAIWPVALKSAP